MTTPEHIEPMTLAEFDAFRIGNNIPVIVGNYPRLRAALADRERMIAEKIEIGTLDDCIQNIRRILDESIKPISAILLSACDRQIVEDCKAEIAEETDIDCLQEHYSETYLAVSDFAKYIIKTARLARIEELKTGK